MMRPNRGKHPYQTFDSRNRQRQALILAPTSKSSPGETWGEPILPTLRVIHL